MAGSLVSLARARVKRLVRRLPPGTGTMTGRIIAGRVHLTFELPVAGLSLSPEQARYWSRALAALASAAEETA